MKTFKKFFQLHTTMGNVNRKDTKVSYEVKYDQSKMQEMIDKIMPVAEKYGFKPEVSLEDGIIKTIQWYKEEFKL